MLIKVMLITFLFTFLPACDKSSEKESRKNQENSQEAQVEVYWTCPMHPQVKEEGPGKCPICGMSLVKAEIDKNELNTSEVKKAGAHINPGDVIARVKLRDAQLSHFHPAYYPVTPMQMEKKIRLLGTVLPSEEKERNISARIPGRVEKVYIKSTGSYVKVGAPVVELYGPQLITTGEEYLLARQNYEKNKTKVFKDLMSQAKERLGHWGIPEFQLETWYKKGKVPRSVTIYAPTSGVVKSRNAVEGKYFNEGDILFKLLELSSVWVEMDVYEHDSAHVELGQDVKLSFTALPGELIVSKIDFIYPVLDPETRTLKVRSTIQNPKGKLKPGMIANAVLKVELGERGMVIPRSAVIDTGKRKVVWVKASEESFRAKIVRTGVESDGYIEVVEGINQDEQVVIEGNFMLDAQAQLFGGYEDFNPTTHQH
jgi:Cu(I)/Ag(I) efflux system membrane fusion protein